MVAPTAATATSIYAVPSQTMVAHLAAAYAVQGDNVPTTRSCIHLLTFFIIEFKNLRICYSDCRKHIDFLYELAIC
jgi:hypothetical protein